LALVVCYINAVHNIIYDLLQSGKATSSLDYKIPAEVYFDEKEKKSQNDILNKAN
jgi:hypothetical protein